MNSFPDEIRVIQTFFINDGFYFNCEWVILQPKANRKTENYSKLIQHFVSIKLNLMLVLRG